MANMEGGAIPEKKKGSPSHLEVISTLSAAAGIAAAGGMAIENHSDKDFKTQVESAYTEMLHMDESTNTLVKDLQGIIKEKGGIDFDQPDFNAKLAVYLDRFAAEHKMEPGAATWARALGEAAVAAMQNNLPPATVAMLMNEFRDYSDFAKADKTSETKKDPLSNGLVPGTDDGGSFDSGDYAPE